MKDLTQQTEWCLLNYERTTGVGLITGLCGEKSRSVKAFKPHVEEDLCHVTD